MTSAIKERPILFSGPMVRALRDGTKTQTRRAVKLPHMNPLGQWEPMLFGGPGGGRTRAGDEIPARWTIAHSRTGEIMGCPYGGPGERLWVREAHWWFQDEHDPVTGYFPPKLTIEDVEYRADGDDGRKIWRPSIHMPRWASRLLLDITDIRVERLQDISEADAKAEGIAAFFRGPERFGKPAASDDTILEMVRGTLGSVRAGYADLWESINGPGSWNANPWVWAVSFRPLSAP